MQELRFRQERDRVLVLLNGRLIADMPWDAADDCWKAMRSVSKLAEEYALANRIIFDHALLLRVGATIGLTNNRKMQAEAAKEAAWNSDLRRYLPGGVKSEEQVGLPRIIQHMPREVMNNGK